MPEQLSKTLLVWGSENIDPKALAQAHRSSKLPFIVGHIALMPDAHFGMGATIGSVIPTRGAIIPAAVGVDIGCGMIAVETDLAAADLPDSLDALLSSIEHHVPAGVGRGHKRGYKRLPGDQFIFDHWNAALADDEKLAIRAADQFGSLGSGNHFIEICLDPDDTVWVVLHSGSRGVGNILARRHIDKAKGLMKERFISLEDKDLAYFVEGEPAFQAYMDDLMWAQAYALGNRETMMDAVLKDLAAATQPFVQQRRINCHHNYSALENHHGQNIWVTRKGAIRAREGDWGVIPGSMGTSSYIVRGLGNPASFQSSAHGAGRTMSRTQAKKTLTVESLTDAMEGTTWLADKAGRLLDEHPDSYKDIDQVMRDQADLVTIEVELHQVLNYKGT